MSKLTKDIFEPYTSIDDLRPPMREVSLQDGYAYATDGNLLIRAKEEDVDFEPEEVEGYPNASKVIEGNIKGNDEALTIQLQDIREALSECPKEDIHKTIKCDECGGEGYEYCIHCHSETECEKCHANGVLVTDEVTGEQYSIYHHIKIKGKWYKAKLWDKIATTADELDEETITYRHEKSAINKPALIEIGPAQILVMVSIVPPHGRENTDHTEIPVSEPTTESLKL